MKKVHKLLLGVGLVLVAWPGFSLAATVWTGPGLAVSSAVQPDKITARFWLARDSRQGLYNSKMESGFAHFFSPADTEWATGTTADYATLAYTDWNTWSKNINGGPPGTVGVNAVLHLITDDIYIDITFTEWFVGGGYAYVRSTPGAVVLPPVFQTVVKSGDTLNLTWSATANQAYQLQFNTNLATTNWVDLGPVVVATGTTVITADTNATAAFPRKFYRVKQMP